ncbi:hypothetical protein ACLMJK_008932 [Lecanora helva]
MLGLNLRHILLLYLLQQINSRRPFARASTDLQNLEPRQNLTLTLNATSKYLPTLPQPPFPFPPTNPPSHSQTPLQWPLSPTHTLTFTTYLPPRTPSTTPERNYFAALLSMQTSLFTNYTLSPFLDDDTIDHNAYGVTIEIDNFGGELDYRVLSEMIGGVGAFMRRWKVVEVGWRLTVVEEGLVGTGRVVSVGVVGRGEGVGGGEGGEGEATA